METNFQELIESAQELGKAKEANRILLLIKEELANLTTKEEAELLWRLLAKI